MPCSQTSSQAERICMHIYMHIHTHTCMSRHLATTMLRENMFVDTYLLLHIHACICIHTYIQWLFAPLDEPTLNNYHLKQPYSPSFPQQRRCPSTEPAPSGNRARPAIAQTIPDSVLPVLPFCVHPRAPLPSISTNNNAAQSLDCLAWKIHEQMWT